MAHPYGLAVFENYIYWTDWNFKSVHRADKFTGNHSRTLLQNLPIQPFDIKVYSPLRQPPGTEFLAVFIISIGLNTFRSLAFFHFIRLVTRLPYYHGVSASLFSTSLHAHELVELAAHVYVEDNNNM